MEDVRKFVGDFFRSLKCSLSWDGRILVVSDVPKSFEDIFGKVGPYRLSFDGTVEGVEFVCKGSPMMSAVLKYLEGAGKASLLRIDFEVDGEVEVRGRVRFRNCDIDSLVKREKDGVFSRFSFVSSFNYLNESERVFSEVYVHKGKVVEGDLSGYSLCEGAEGRAQKIDMALVKKDYGVAKARVVELSAAKQEEISGILKREMESEIERINKHYERALGEVGGDLNGKLRKVRELELEIRSSEEGVRGRIRKKLDRLRKSLVKIGDDEAVSRILKEKEMTVRDVMHKYSLNVERKLVNTAVIYYPVYTFKLHLKNGNVSGRILEVGYNPLTGEFDGFSCEVCSRALSEVSLCSNGHVCCEECLGRCGECGEVFCEKCLLKKCFVCGKSLCKGCVKMCLGCGRSVCATHLREDCVSGEERCVSCLRACLRCHGMCEERFFGEAADGSKVCSKCLGVERRGRVLRKVFGG